MTTNYDFNISPFVCADRLDAGIQWEDWMDDFETECRFRKVNTAQNKLDALKIFGGKEIKRLVKYLPDPDDAPDGTDAYGKVKLKLTAHFLPQKNTYHAIYLFNKIRRERHESISQFATRLREKAARCEFADQDSRILEHLIQYMDNPELTRKAISKKWNLGNLLKEAAELEDTKQQVDDMRIEKEDYTNNSSVVAENETETPSSVHRIGMSRGKTRRTTTREEPRGKNIACKFCGLTNKHPPGRNCPAYGKFCDICGRKNHFATVCRAPQDKKVRAMYRDDKSETSSDEEYLQAATKHVHREKRIFTVIKKTRRSSNSKTTENTVYVRINDIDMAAEPDTGAEVNVMDEHQYKALQKHSPETASLRHTNTQLSTLNSGLIVKGVFPVTLGNKTRGIRTKMYVVRGKMKSKPLLSRDTLEDLGMLEIRQDGSLRERNEKRIKTMKMDTITSRRGRSTERKQPAQERVEDKSIEERLNLNDVPKSTRKIVLKYKDRFTGIGKIKDYKNDREIFAKFNMKPNATPVAQKPRPVPYNLQKPLKHWLDDMVAEDVFEWVPTGEAIQWCSNLHVEPKPKYADIPTDELTSSQIRAAIDMRIANESMERNRIVQSPVIEDFTHKFAKCIKFGKLDMNWGYLQSLLHPDSREVATFSTPWGNIRPKRLIFGAKSSQDAFDEIVYKIFGDIPNCLNQRDDILIGGEDLESFNEALDAVLQRARDFGVTFNPEKAIFASSDLTFYGHRFTSEGLKPTKEKIEAVTKCPPPESKSAVRSFLGMTGYLSKFIPNYSTLTAPLRKLTLKDTKFHWGPEEELAFNKLKSCITSEDTMVFYSVNRPTVLRTEASFNEGLSAGLFQETGKGLQPVAYISRTMTDAEKRYSQTEKDALAIKWAKNRLSMYLKGAPRFKIVTSHKPLLTLFNKPTSKPPPRIERWIMDMQDTDFELCYEPGKDENDPMDYLSRHPVPGGKENSTEKIIRRIVQDEHAVIMPHIKEEAKQDIQMQKLRDRIRNEDWEIFRTDEHISPFYSIRKELYEVDGLILRDKQIIIPEKLRRKTVRAAHSLGHFGSNRIKSMLRKKYWFPRMDQLVEEISGQCYDCLITTKTHQKEPLKMTEIPDRPWDTVAADFGGPYPDGHYNLVVIDKRTRYPEVEETRSTAFQPTREKMSKIFSTHGTPNVLESDNGPPFNSHDFANFAEQEGFHHHPVTPDHPQANGTAESFMKVLNKTEQIAHQQKANRRIAVQGMLAGYRSTPHPATQIAPYDAMLLDRNIRTKLDYEHPQREMDPKSKEINEHDRAYKNKIKENSENRNTKQHSFKINDYVVLLQKKVNKFSTAYEPAFYVVYKIQGSTICARRTTDGREITRDASKFKNANKVLQAIEEDVQQPDQQVVVDLPKHTENIQISDKVTHNYELRSHTKEKQA